MSLIVTQRPEVTAFTETSKWNAIGNPIVYKLQRKDYIFNQINDSGGSIQLQFNATDISADFTIGDTLYIKSDNGVYDIQAVVTAKSFSTNTLITVDQAYISPAPGGFTNNLLTRTGYKLLINVYRALSNVLLNATPLTFSPNSKGELIVYVNSVLRPLMKSDNIYTGGVSYLHDSNGYIRFYIEYTETWDADVTDPLVYTSDSANVYYSIIGTRQIPSLYGGNMFEYVPWPDKDPKSKWLTKLKKPVMWKGWPLQLSYIADVMDDTDSYMVFLMNTPTLPTTHFSTGDTQLSDNQVNIEKIDENYDSGNFDDGDETIYATLITNDLPIDATDFISETLPIELREPCDNPIMLQARNSLGGVLQWLFYYGQEYTFQYADGNKRKRLTVFAENLTINEWESLHDFITVGEVYGNSITEFNSSIIKTHSRTDQQVYVLNQDGSKVGVIVITTQNTTSTRNARHKFELTIEYPEIFSI